MRIAVLTSGGDAPGMNAAIRAVVRTVDGAGGEAVGVRHGFAGLLAADWLPLGARDVGGIVDRGGTMLGSARCPEFRTANTQERAAANLRAAGVDVSNLPASTPNSATTGQTLQRPGNQGKLMSAHPVIALSLFFAACEGASTDPVAEPAHPSTHSSPPNATPTPTESGSAAADRMFLEMMVPHHVGAVDMARIALERAEHPEIKSLAESILASQEAEVTTMTAWRKAWFGSDAASAQGGSMEQPGMSGHAGMADMTKSIEALKTAKPFDLAFIDAMIPHHQDALRMAQEVRAKTERPEIKDLADRITVAQQKEIDQMQEWRKAWFPTAELAPGMKR